MDKPKRRSDAVQFIAEENESVPLHTYSRQQAIQDGLLLDVLQNYTNYESAFHLAHKERNFNGGRFGGERYGAIFPLVQDAKICDQTTSEHQAARKEVLDWIRRYAGTISKKGESVIEHFRTIVAPLLKSETAALVVAGNPREAEHWRAALEQYVADQNYDIRIEMDDRTEGGGIQILLTTAHLAADSIQPRLCGMYVDKRLGGTEIVATFSQLGRSFPGKTATYIVDFANEPSEVLAAFRTEDPAARISVPADSVRLSDLCAKLDSSGFYDASGVTHLITHESAKTQGNPREAAVIAGRRLMEQYERNGNVKAVGPGSPAASNAGREELVRFKAEVAEFLRGYTYLSQLFNYNYTPIKKRAVFFQHLLPRLEFGDGTDR